MKKYRKKPVVIEAMLLEYNTDVIEKIEKWSEGNCLRQFDGNMVIHTLEGNMIASSGDYIIKEVNGEFYPCKPDIFKQTYTLENEN